MASRSARIGLGIGLGLVAFACTPFSGDSAPDTTEAGAGAAGIAADAADPDGAVPFDTDDAGPALAPIDDLDGGVEAGLNGCVQIVPVNVITVPAAADGVVCKPQNVLVGDGTAVGLDLKVGGVAVKIAGATVTSCIGVDFGAGINTAFVRMRAVAKACDTPCNGACGTGDTAKIFAGATQASLVNLLPNASPTAAFKTFRIPIPSGNTGRFVVVCRGGFEAARDDIEVDSIRGCR